MSGSYGKAPKYVSPFVADALYRAKLRSNNAAKARSQRRTASVRESEDSGGGWDSSVSRNALFDPKLHKQELFKLTPRRPAPRDDSHDRHTHGASHRDRDGHDSDSPHEHAERGAPRLTRRRPDSSPPRRPARHPLPHTTGGSPNRPTVRGSLDHASRDTRDGPGSFVGRDLSEPYVKVCNACHGGDGVHTHGHAHGQAHGHTHRSPARKSSPARANSPHAAERRPPLPHSREPVRQTAHPHAHAAAGGHPGRRSQDSLVSRARAELDDGDDSVIRVVTRATSPIDEMTLQYLQEGRDPSWVALSGLDPGPQMKLPPPPAARHDLHPSDIDRRHPPILPSPQHSAYGHYPSPAPASAVSYRNDPRSTPLVQGSAFAPRTGAHKAPHNTPYENGFVSSVPGTPAHDLNIPRFQSSLDQSQFEESAHPAGGIEDVYKMQVHAQTQVIESIAKMMETIAGLSKKEKRKRRRRFQLSQPITVHIGEGSRGPYSVGPAPPQDATGDVRVVGATGPPTLSKAAIMDLILAKLQNLDKLENEILNDVLGPDSERTGYAANRSFSGRPSEAAGTDAPAVVPAPVPHIMSMLPAGSPSKSRPGQLSGLAMGDEAAPLVAPSPEKAGFSANISIVDPNPKPEETKKVLGDQNLETVLYDKEKKHEFRQFVKELENAKAKQEVPFKANGLTMFEAIEMYSDSLYEEYVDSISKEIGKTLDSYAEELFETI